MTIDRAQPDNEDDNKPETGSNEAVLRLPDDGEVVVDIEPLAKRIGSEVRTEFQQLHIGPLPPPEELAEYDKVVPGLAERLIAMTEREQAHRHDIQITSVKTGFEIAARGQHYGLAVAILVLTLAAIFAFLGYPVEGAAIATADLVALTAVFVIGRHYSARTTKPEARKGGDEQRLVGYRK
jgi:uncharacterized membrane protein